MVTILLRNTIIKDEKTKFYTVLILTMKIPKITQLGKALGDRQRPHHLETLDEDKVWDFPIIFALSEERIDCFHLEMT